MEEGVQLKQQLLDLARRQIQEGLALTQQSMQRLEDAFANETKSSAGDKFETGRAMLHLEQQKLQQQLATTSARLQAVNRITRSKPTHLIAEGSLVATNRGLYLVGLGLGKVRLNGRVVFCTSLDSPIGKALVGKQVGATFTFNGLEFTVRGLV